jgi:isopenicillin N synthase-like dioxygenase
MSSIQVVDFQTADAAADFAKTIKETGFGVLSNHPIDTKLVDEVYALWDAFFNSDAKHNPDYAFDEKDHAGYICSERSETAKGFEQKDIKEFYHYYHPWGRIPPMLAEKTQQLCEQLIEMGSTLLGWVEQHAPEAVKAHFSEHLSDMIKGSQKHLFRLIHYPPLTGDEPEGAVRAAEHGDINFLTLLPAATAKGLEAKDSQGDWVPVPCNPGWIIVNVGDMLQECTDHYYPSTLHRVVNPEGEDAKQPRMSMPLFLHPRDEVQLSARHTAKSYREERYRELGLLKDGESVE